jgi:dTDP-N-acetylfucosamine:lipid II N-acetylfucosaminyltransferase
MLLHLLSDPDFDSYIIYQFEEVNERNNYYIVFSDAHHDKLKEKYPNLFLLNYRCSSNLMNITIQGIFVHFMTVKCARLINDLKKNVPVFWSIWGGDVYYQFISFHHNLYGSRTKLYLIKKNGFLLQPYYCAKKYIKYLLSNDLKLMKSAIGKVNFYSTIIPTEVELVKKVLPQYAKYIRINVGTISNFAPNTNIYADIFSREETRLNFFIGNSSMPTNNHLDILKILKKKKTLNIKITMPLSYGIKDYAKDIISIYTKTFHDNIEFLEDILPLKKYIEIIYRQNIFIYYSFRQQGVGNIISALWSGGKVFLSTKNITLDYFKQIGIILFSVENDFLDKSIEEITEPLTKDQIIHNREILLKDLSEEMIIQRTRESITAMNNYKMVENLVMKATSYIPDE